MSATVNTFPPFHELTFRHWTLLGIIGLHVAFFWALNSGMTPSFERLGIPHVTLLPSVPDKQSQREPEPVEKSDPVTIVDPTLPPPLSPPKIEGLDDLPIPEGALVVPAGPGTTVVDETPRAPVVVEPQADPRVGLSAPAYPASSIRNGHEGTVLLSVYVLENGRVGEVRIERSSGHEKLDQAAVREARRWRFTPGMRDGVPVPMWKQVPITYQLREEGRSPVLRF